jgi:PAS domain S-box-containing protein
LNIVENWRVLIKRCIDMTWTQKRFTTFIELLEDGYYEVDLAGNFVSFNQAMCEILGYGSAELTGMNNRIFMDPENAKKAFDTFNQVFRTKKECRASGWQFIRKDGSVRHVDTSVALLTGTDGEPAGFHGIVRDVTEKKNLEIRLQQSQRLEAIGTLASGISHDFNNILSGIFGYAQLAQSSLDNPQKTKQHIDQVIASAQRAAELVQQVMTFSRRAEEVKKPFRIYLIVKESMKLLRASFPANIEMDTRVSSRQMVLADPSKIHQVLMNLCHNAYQAMKKDGGVLTVSLTDETINRPKQVKGRQIAAGDYLKLAVSDTGHGMDEKTLETVFNPDNDDKKTGQAFGLGLAAVQAVVDAYDGWLHVQSRPDKGTAVEIYFPVAGTEKKQTAPDEPAGAGSADGPQGSLETIMLVDDEKALRQIFEEFFRNYGYQVRLFENGMDALAAFEKEPDVFDLIITDMTMPGVTGDKLSQKILKIRPEQPIILWCGFSEDISEKTAIEMGIKKYIQKPVSPRDLLQAIRQILDEK